jgi:hypothetical protein
VSSPNVIGFDYFEVQFRRPPGRNPIDRRSLARKKYPDVGSAVTAGTIKSAADHFYSVGAAERRSPNQAYEAPAAEWKTALGK